MQDRVMYSMGRKENDGVLCSWMSSSDVMRRFQNEQ